MMMNGMMGWPMAVFGILLLVLMVLAIAVLAKYLLGSGQKIAAPPPIQARVASPLGLSR